VEILANTRLPAISSLGYIYLGTALVVGSPIPTGTVTFLDGTKMIGTTTLGSSGVARLSTFFTTLGIHTITANYSGDTWNAPSISPLLEQEIDIRIDTPF
jgi:hypothetical protein